MSDIKPLGPSDPPPPRVSNFWDLFDKTQPFWLPPGTIRAMLAVSIIWSYLAFSFHAGWSPAPDLTAMANLAVGYYIGSKVSTGG